MIQNITDLHTHGIGKYDTRTNKPEDILRMAELHKKAGSSAILPTIYPASIKEMRENIEAVKQAMQEQKSRRAEVRQPAALTRLRTSALILGVHLEGPFLNPLRCGALDKRSFIKPTPSSLKKLIDTHEDIIKIITIAPEMPGALKIIEKCVELGIQVNMGHSDATYEQALDGKKAGATGITHLFNAMRPFHHREPGLAGLGLLDSELYIEVIADGIHLHPRTLELVFSKKRLDKIMLVSDSVKSNPPIPTLVKVGKGGFSGEKGMPIYNEKGILAGSNVTISASIKVLKGAGIPEAEIIEAVSDNPRRYLHIEPDI